MPTAGQTTGTAWDDGRLVRLAQQGEPGAFDSLFERHYARIFNFALKMEGNRDNAADIAQTAFVRAYQALGGIRDGQAFVAFLYRIVVNLVRDRAKSARRKPWVRFADLWRPDAGQESETEPIEFADGSQDPELLTAHRERDRALAAAIGALPLEFREVLVLHHLQGMDVRDIAAVVGVAEGTVKSRLSRARQRLRSALSEWVEGGNA